MYIKNHFYWFLPGTLHFVIIVKSDITPGFIYHTADQKRRSIMDLFGFLYKIEELNNNYSFLNFRERYIRLYSLIMVAVAITLIMSFHCLDYILELENLKELLFIRSATCMLLFIIGITVYSSAPNRILNKIQVYTGFYILSVFSGFISHYAGIGGSSYWGGLNFMLIFWLTLVPFTYRELILNSIFFVIIYDVIILVLNPGPIHWNKIIEYHYFFSGTIMLGSVVAYLANANAARLYTNQKELETEKAKLTLRNETIEYGIALARKIQSQLIPRPDPTDYIYSLYRPMQEVGGDLYDFVRFKNSDKIGVFISDVSGHGVPAAFITSMIKTTIHQSGRRKENPAELMYYINEVLHNQTAENFITAFYGIFDPAARSILYSNAGHPNPFVITDRGINQLPKGNNTALALFSNEELEFNDKSYHNFEEIIQPDSKILFYTDGLTETCPVNGQAFFEDEMIENILVQSRILPARLFIDRLYSGLISFRGRDSFEDDVCMVCLDVI